GRPSRPRPGDLGSPAGGETEVTADWLHPSGRWQRAPGDDRVDAALLFPALRGAIPPGDPRALATMEAARTELSSDGYMYRYRPDDRPLGESEGASCCAASPWRWPC